MANTFAHDEMQRLDRIRQVDPAAARIASEEYDRQLQGIELIASENFVSSAVLDAMATVLTNKYAEGYPGKRYYSGCQVVDQAEELARDRAKELFGAEHANVQPHSGTQANMAVYFAVLEPGETVLGMDLAHGGHLSHGSPVNFSGRQYHFESYGVNKETMQIDYDAVRAKAKEVQPKLIVTGASAYPRTIDFEAFREIADEVGAYLMADIAHIAGLVAAGLHPSPVGVADFVTTTTHKTLRGPRGAIILTQEEHAKTIDKAIFPGIQGGPLMHTILAKAVCFGEALHPAWAQYQRRIVENAKALARSLRAQGLDLVSGGTDNHLMLANVESVGLTGKEAEAVLERCHISVNKNMIPFDERSPFVTSGIRIGTPAVTTRGFGTAEMEQIASWISSALQHPDDEEKLDSIASAVRQLTSRFPLHESV